ncbi:MAG: hypothetical protein BWY15_01992 [Firmicutes bacterium ADurb.Bin193]|nr:MAG: hypothetical protein BWY15_01992 [Firmicutes bacterium ADurb.Bin193]
MGGKKNSGKAKDIFWRIVITTVGVMLIVLALSRTALFFFGETAPATFSARRVGGADHDRTSSQRYEWSISYTFTDKYGRQQSGVSTRRGSDLSVKTGERVAYFSAAPFISAIADETEPDGGKLLLLGLGLLLIWAMNNKKKNRNQADLVGCRVNLTDCDDSADEIYNDNEKQR